MRHFRFLFTTLAFAAVLALSPAFAAAADQPAPKSFAPDVGSLGTKTIDFDQTWRTDSAGNLSDAGQAARKLAQRGKDYWKNQLPSELSQPGESYKNLSYNLDVGRHEIIKSLITKAITRANKQLIGSPIKRVQTVNSGSTGNVTRDIDLTAMVGDAHREKVFMLALEAEAQAMDLKGAKFDPKAGLSIPELEVEFHRGTISPPQLHECLDLQEFILKYDKVVESQVRNPEAYIGGGAVTEVQGRASQTFKPGKTYVQTFDVSDTGAIAYRGDKAVTPREAQAILSTPLRERYRMGERAMNIYCGYREAVGHEATGDKDLSKGPLKYASRALDQLCEIQGRKPYASLTADEKLEVAASVFEPGALEDPARRKLVERMVKSLDKLPQTLAEAKTLGAKAATDNTSPIAAEAGIARIFLRQAAATTLGQLAREMLNPPYDPKFVDEMIRSQNWDKLGASQRTALAARLDENYKKAVSTMAMTDLLAVTWTLQTMDLPESDSRGIRPGSTVLKQLIESSDNPKIKKILELAEEHGRCAVTAECSTDVRARVAARNRMSVIRTELFNTTADSPSPGKTVIEQAEKMGGQSYVKRLKDGSRPSWEPEVADSRARFKDMISKMTGDEETAAARKKLQSAMDAPSSRNNAYLKQRLSSEVFSLGTVVDGLTLIELYQKGASNSDLVSAFGIQVVSRAHWSIGFLRAAANLDLNDEKGWKALGQEAAFWTAAHYLPSVAGTVKLVFDIEHGIIKVTLLPTMNALDDDLIDALYTGTAGRKDDGMANWGSRYREGVDAILDAKYISKSTDPKTGKPVIDIDRMRLFRDKFTLWANMPYDDERITIGNSDPLIREFANYLKVRQAQLESQESSWVSSNKFTPSPLPDQGKVKEAFDRFRALVMHKIETDVSRVLTESAARKSVRFHEPEDRIRDGLIERYSTDILLGMEWALQTDLAEKALARRQLERTAALADLETIAKSLSNNITNPAPSDNPTFELAVGIDHPATQIEFDGTEPLPLVCQLKLRGNRPANMPDAVLEISPGPVANVNNSAAFKSGDVVHGPVTVRALVAGKEVASQTLDLRVRLGQPKPQLVVGEPQRLAPKQKFSIGAYSPQARGKQFAYKWNTGDGTVFTEPKGICEHSYDKVGDYTITVQLLDNTNPNAPKILATGTTSAKVVVTNVLARLQKTNLVGGGVNLTADLANGETRNIACFISPDTTPPYIPITWSGNTCNWTWDKTDPEPTGQIRHATLVATFSDDGRTLLRAVYKFNAKARQNDYEFSQSFEFRNLPLTNVVETIDDKTDIANFDFSAPVPKNKEALVDFTRIEKRIDTSTGKVWDDQSAKKYYFVTDKPVLYNLSLGFSHREGWPPKSGR